MNSQYTTTAGFPPQTLDLSASLSYGLFYQPVIGSNAFNSHTASLHCASDHRRSIQIQLYQKRLLA